ncbi:MAG: sugar transferase [Planctomycetes bacterium]|nr:sugar transferase [Planctomycetota bacterium]
MTHSTEPRRLGWLQRLRGAPRLPCLTPAAFEAAFELEATRSERSGHPLSLVVFVAEPGSDARKQLDSLLSSVDARKRQYDTIGQLEALRVGVLLPYTSTSGAWSFANAVLRDVGRDVGRIIATVSSNEVGPNGQPTPAPRRKRAARAPLAPRTKRTIEPAVPEEIADETPSPAADEADARAVVSIWREFDRRPSVGKRIVDIVGSGIALVVLSPLLVATSVAVKLSSPGPVFFRQERAGQFGQPFKLIKFRSMFIDAEARKRDLMHLNEMDGPVFKIKNDPRITPIGRWLRRLSIDELPQFYNVLRGDMSLVGPRPPMISELPGYEQWHLRRLTRRGGLTCIWQTSGRNQVTFQEWMRMDRRYLRRESMMTDLSLLAKTVWTVTTGKGAS